MFAPLPNLAMDAALIPAASFKSFLFISLSINSEMVIVPEQAEVVKEIFAGCLAGKSTQIIAKELNEKGVPTKKGAKWTGGTINGILTNEKYIGDALFQKTITDASFKKQS